MNKFLFIEYPLKNPWTNVYGFARSILALGTILTLMFNNSETLFPTSISEAESMQYETLYVLRINFFYIFRNFQEIGRVVAIILLFTVIVGYWPKITGILHFWISLSFSSYCSIIEGGDQITSVLCFLLLPICVTEPRKSHWHKPVIIETAGSDFRKLFALSSFLFIRIQASLIYMHAATAKFNVREWIDGTATWYWFQDPTFGMNRYIMQIMEPVMHFPVFMAILTWGSLAVELSLFLCLFLEPEKRRYFLLIGVGFHFVILIVHGLVTFFFAMAGLLVLYLRPVNKEFDWPRKLDSVRPFLKLIPNKRF